MRKCEIATNILAICTMNEEFIFVTLGWEGFVADSRVLKDAISWPNGLKVLKGKNTKIGYISIDHYYNPHTIITNTVFQTTPNNSTFNLLNFEIKEKERK